VSSNHVTVNTVTDATTWFVYDTANMIVRNVEHPQARDIYLYEADDEVSPTTVMFEVSRGTASTNNFAWTPLPDWANLTNCKFIGYWLKSDITGNSVKLSIGETTPTTVSYITCNSATTDWTYHYWPIDSIASTDKDHITFMELQYLGDSQGNIYLGAVDAYDYLDNEETITSTPNDYIQYRAILGSTAYIISPKLIELNEYVIKLDYSAALGDPESSLSSYWYSKPFDMQNEYNKLFNWVELTAETKNPTTGNTVYLDYNCDDGYREGTLSSSFDVTSQRVKLRFWFPSGTYGKEIQLKIYDNDVDSDLSINNLLLSYHQEGGSDGN